MVEVSSVCQSDVGAWMGRRDPVHFDCAVYIFCLRPHHVESTSSRPITEVKQHRVSLVLGWVTAWEYEML